MKKILTIAALFSSICCALAQDIIILKDSKRIDAKIEEVSEETVKYKKWSNQEGPSFVINKSRLSVIVYANGEVEVVNSDATIVQNDNSYANIEREDNAKTNNVILPSEVSSQVSSEISVLNSFKESMPKFSY